MSIGEIEQLPAVQQAAGVLAALQRRGLMEPAIASGWTRGLLMNMPPSDIDVSYVGPVQYSEAQTHLRDALKECKADPSAWDIEGIWNATEAYGFTHIVDNFLIYYVDSIDSVYLAADGKLHDATGFGYEDAASKTLRINMYDSRNGRMPTPKEDVYICLEGCRRIAQFSWKPTPESVKRIVGGLRSWSLLSPGDREYFYKRISNKYSPADFPTAQKSYAAYGWDFIFGQ